MRVFLLCSLALMICTTNTVLGQDKIESDHDNFEELQFRLWTGYSFNSVYLLGKTKNTISKIIGIGFKRHIRNYESGAKLYYTADVIPFVEYEYPKRDDGDNFHLAKGFGISPIGFQLMNSITPQVSYSMSISGSFIIMDNTFPTDKGRKLNFTFDPSIALNTKLNSNLSLNLGYKFHHISNAQTGKENPGIDSNFLFLSLIFK